MSDKINIVVSDETFKEFDKLQSLLKKAISLEKKLSFFGIGLSINKTNIKKFKVTFCK